LNRRDTGSATVPIPNTMVYTRVESPNPLDIYT
jgi:hypothetical protein